MGRTLEHFIRFTSDSSGLERTLRFFHSAAVIFSSHDLAFRSLLWALALAGHSQLEGKAGPAASAVHAAVLGVADRLNLARRLMRVFAFAGCFHAAHKLLSSSNNANKSNNKTGTGGGGGGGGLSLELWLDLLAHTFNGAYLLLETAATPDDLGVPGLGLWGPGAVGAMGVEGMRFWLFALVCGAAACVVRIAKVLALAPAPASAGEAGYGVAGGGEKEQPGAAAAAAGSEEVEVEEEEKEKGGDKDDSLRREQRRLRGIVGARRGGVAARRREVRALARSAAAQALDVAIPGSAVGWLALSPAVVGWAMMATTLLTGAEAWERCGREVEQQQQQQTESAGGEGE